MAEKRRNTQSSADHTAAYWIIGVVLLGFLVWLFYPLLAPVVNGTGNVNFVTLFINVWLTRIKPVVIILDILLLAVFFFSWFKVRPLMPKLSLFEKPTLIKSTASRRQDSQIAAHWRVILARARTGTPDGLRVAIQEADALVDLYLKKSGYQGDTMADRLAQVLPTQAPSIDRLWDAHRLRNELAHTPGASVDAEGAKEALTAYQDFLKQLGAL